jgi:hypothetical protein
MLNFVSLIGRASVLSFVLFSAAASTTFAQNAIDEDTPEPVDATEFDASQFESDQPQALVDDGEDSNQPRTGALKSPAPGGTFRSDTLGGDFLCQFMRITIGGRQNGQSFQFWGARAVSLDHDSPLRDLRMRMNNGTVQKFQPGDVLTRLDNVKVDEDKFQNRKGVWQMPELDEHFGPTTVRWIKSGHSHVNIGQIMLDNDATRGIGGGHVVPVTP